MRGDSWLPIPLVWSEVRAVLDLMRAGVDWISDWECRGIYQARRRDEQQKDERRPGT